jgi:hypothetical protein
VSVFERRAKGSCAAVTRNLPLIAALAAMVAIAVPASAPAQNGGTTAGQSATPTAPAARPQVGIEDENVIFGPGAPVIAANWRSMGVDSVRVQAYWDAISPAGNSPTRPGGFNPADPNDPQYSWGPLDRAISIVRNNGMRVNLTINQCGPRWASLQPGNATKCWRPSPALFAQFAAAVGRRYGGQVDVYLLGSEPNQRPFLAPQFTCGRRCTPDAPHQYRNLVNAAYPALKAADRGSQIVIGELAPIGSRPSRSGGIKPLLFIRELGCVNARFRRITTGNCRRFRAAKGDAFGYHPYVNNRRAPTVGNADPDIAKIGDIPKLLRTLDTESTRGRIRPSRGRRFAVLFTEYGYISNPPSGRFGVSLARQAAYNSESAYIVWRSRSRIKLLSQYLWMDDPTFATGLILSNGRMKPSFFTFPHPFWIDGRLRSARFWGQVRPDASRTITLQIKTRGSKSFRNVRRARTDAGGYWTFVGRAVRGATYRFAYSPSNAAPATSATLPAPRR